MKRKEIISLFILFFGFFPKTNGQSLKTAKYAGVYSFGKNVEKGSVGSVTIYPESDTTVLFYIDICRGAPSYNLGQRYNRLKIKSGVAIFFVKEGFDEKGCKWQLTIKNQILTVQTLDGCYECGFGGNVYADNRYVLTDKAIPKYFIDGHKHKIYFSKTSPENYLR